MRPEFRFDGICRRGRAASPMIGACIGLLAGMYLPQLSSFPFSSDCRDALAFGCLLLVAARRHAWLAAAMAGVVLFHVDAGTVMAQRLSPLYSGDSMLTEVLIVDFPRASGDAVSFVAVPTGDHRIPPRVRLSWYRPPVPPRLGDLWQLELRLKRPRGARNPGGFDYETWLLRERVGATGYVVDGHRNRLLDIGQSGRVDRLRKRVVERIFQVLGDGEAAAVVAAIAVGARHGIREEQWRRYAATGTSHLMAISGLHVGLVGAAAYVFGTVLFGLLRRPSNRRDAALVVAIGAAGGYALLSGLGVPSQRAALMLVAAAAIVLCRREPDGVVLLASAALVTATAAPLSTMAPGFMLSFGAVLCLLWLARQRPLREERIARRALAAGRALGAVQLRLLFGLAPLTILLFDRFAPVAPLVNAVGVPLFAFVTVPAALLGALLDGPVSAIGDGALKIAAVSVAVLERFIALAAGLPGASRSIAAVEGIAWLTLVLPLAAAVLPRGFPGRAAGALALLALLLERPAPPPPGCADVRILDVGQGLAVVVETHRHALLYDTGPSFRGGGSMAERVVLPYLASRGIGRLHLLVVSHADLDHAGGLVQILAALPAERVLAGEPLPGAASQCAAGEHWYFDQVRFEMLHPPGNGPGGNDVSCVLLVEAGEFRLLLTGDIESPAETRLVEAGVLPPVDVVLVPHHGSRTSSTGPFVAALGAKLAVVSAGHGNRWGFPKPEVVRRWQTAGAAVLSTSTAGAVGVRLCRGEGVVSVESAAASRRRFWHDDD